MGTVIVSHRCRELQQATPRWVPSGGSRTTSWLGRQLWQDRSAVRGSAARAWRWVAHAGFPGEGPRRCSRDNCLARQEVWLPREC